MDIQYKNVLKCLKQLLVHSKSYVINIIINIIILLIFYISYGKARKLPLFQFKLIFFQLSVATHD